MRSASRRSPRRRRIDEAVESDPPPLVDRGHQVAGAELAPAFTVHDHRGIEPEDVARLADQPILPEGGDVLFAEPLDVETIARHEVPDPLDRLRRTDQPAGAAARDLARLAHREATADRAVVGRYVGLRILRSAIEHHRDDLRDHIAGALHDDGIADADILTGDLVLIVQGGALDDDTADGDRLEHRDRSERALAANLDRDVAQHRLRLLRREFLRDRPARRP